MSARLVLGSDTSGQAHIWKTDAEIGYADHGREWCVTCGLRRLRKHEGAECLGRCSVVVNKGIRSRNRSCSYSAVGFINGAPVCSLHLKAHEAKLRKIEKLKQELARLENSN